MIQTTILPYHLFYLNGYQLWQGFRAFGIFWICIEQLSQNLGKKIQEEVPCIHQSQQKAMILGMQYDSLLWESTFWNTKVVTTKVRKASERCLITSWMCNLVNKLDNQPKLFRFRRGSNSRPSACKADVITTTLRNLVIINIRICNTYPSYNDIHRTGDLV